MELLVARFELSPAAADSSSSLEGAAVVLLTQLVVTSSSNLLVPKYYLSVCLRSSFSTSPAARGQWDHSDNSCCFLFFSSQLF